MTAAGLEAEAEPVVEADSVLVGEVRRRSWRPTGSRAETAARCWPEISTQRSPSPALSSSHRAP